MKILLLKFIMIVAVITLTSCKNEEISNKDLFTLFQNPPTEAKPFVRWWWNGNCIEEKELIRELDILKEAGIGGVEINPIGMPEEIDKKINCECYDWLSPEWNQLIKSAVEGASERDMIVDLIMGSGWPFGGRFLSKNERIQGVGINRIKLSGPNKYKMKVEDISKAPGSARHAFKEAEPSELFFLRLVPDNAIGTADVIDLMNNVDESGVINLDIPKGNYTMFIGSYQYGFRQVYNGAPGSDGPVLDHFNKTAVLKYMNKFSEALEPVLGGKLGEKIRALFSDSIELAGANWTTDFKNEFVKVNGYDPSPWYPFIFYDAYAGYTDTLEYSQALNDSIQRVRYDFNSTLVDVFMNRFRKTFHEWAHEHGLLSRFQAIGYPWLVGMSEGYMIPDIPESCYWLFSRTEMKEHGCWIWNKYASSSGHLADKRIISSESMTNTLGVFRTTMNQFKKFDDFNFITGINHSVLHGFNYSPPEAGFPGWIRYGTYFNENNTWWRYFPLWSKYNARLSAVFQEANPMAEIAILAPFADRYGEDGLHRKKIHLKPWYVHDLWESCSQVGYNADYLNEKVIQNADFNSGNLKYGKMSYQILFVAGAKSLQSETAQALEKYSKAGGNIIFIEHLPERTPSLNNFTKNDEILKLSINKAIRSNTVELIQPPKEDKLNLLKWTSEILNRYDIKSTIKIKQPNLNLFQNHFEYGEQKIYFFSNQNKEETISFDAEFLVENNLVPWIWFPESGERKLYPPGKEYGKLSLVLQPLESALIVWDEKSNAKMYEPIQRSSSSKKEIKNLWNITFNHMNGDSFNVKSDDLIDFGKSDDKRISTFAGTATYETTLILGKEDLHFLDLGDVSKGITELYLNEEKVGVKWFGNHLYDLKGTAKIGENNIKIVYTTVLANYMLSMEESIVAKKWTKGWKDKADIIKQGIVGPISIIKVKNIEVEN